MTVAKQCEEVRRVNLTFQVRSHLLAHCAYCAKNKEEDNDSQVINLSIIIQGVQLLSHPVYSLAKITLQHYYCLIFYPKPSLCF